MDEWVNRMPSRILIVEDEAPIREMLAFVMEHNGYPAYASSRLSQQALEKVVEPYTDMILLTWMIPWRSWDSISAYV